MPDAELPLCTLTLAVRHADGMTVGDDVDAALRELVHTMDTLPGTYRPEFSLTYWAGVAEGAEAWSCTVEGDIHGDDGDSFTILAQTATEALVRAREESLRRVP